MSEQPRSFLQRRPLRRALYNWLERHQHPFNRGIHFLGIPLALAGVILFFTLPWDEWYWGVLAFVGGYMLQWIGHLVEGNDLGEWAGIKRMLGWPYVAIAPCPVLPSPPVLRGRGVGGEGDPSPLSSGERGVGLPLPPSDVDKCP